jgi:hypothetical protein
LSLAYFTEHEVLQFHPFTYKQHNFILLYSWIKLCCLYIPHFLIHLSVVGHLGCFQSLAIVNSAAINMGVQVALWYPGLHSSIYMLRSGIAGSYDSFLFVFWGTSMLLSIVIALIYITTNSVEMFLFLYIVTSICCVVLLMIVIFTGVR